MKAEIESKATILPKVRDWHGLKNDEGELERSEMDPNRFSKRGGAMLREEKLRKRVGILLPRVSDLLMCLGNVLLMGNLGRNRAVDTIAFVGRGQWPAIHGARRASNRYHTRRSRSERTSQRGQEGE